MVTLGVMTSKAIAETAVKKTAEQLGRELGKRTALEVADEAMDATESESVEKIGKPLVHEGVSLAGGAKGAELPKKKLEQPIFKNGPQDVIFDIGKNQLGDDAVCLDASRFRSGIECVGYRKLAPDAMIVKQRTREIFYVRDVYPSECSNTVTDLPDKAKAEATIREFDERFEAKPRLWQPPREIPDGFEERLLIRIPATERKLIDALSLELRLRNREPELLERNGVALIKYNIDRVTWEDRAVGVEDGKKVYELNACKSTDGTRNPDRILLNQHPLPENSLFRVKMADGVVAIFETDSQGRVERVSVDKLKLVPEAERLRDGNRTSETRNIKDGFICDDGGHILADIFGGSSDQINLIPMDREVNRHGPWRLMEENIASTLKGPPPKEVSNFTVKIRYEGDAARPTSLRVAYSVEGDPKPKTVFVNNVAHGEEIRNAA